MVVRGNLVSEIDCARGETTRRCSRVAGVGCVELLVLVFMVQALEYMICVTSFVTFCILFHMIN